MYQWVRLPHIPLQNRGDHLHEHRHHKDVQYFYVRVKQVFGLHFGIAGECLQSLIRYGQVLKRPFFRREHPFFLQGILPPYLHDQFFLKFRKSQPMNRSHCHPDRFPRLHPIARGRVVQQKHLLNHQEFFLIHYESEGASQYVPVVLYLNRTHHAGTDALFRGIDPVPPETGCQFVSTDLWSGFSSE